MRPAVRRTLEVLAVGVMAVGGAGCGAEPGTEGQETAQACRESELVAQCPPGSSPVLGSAGESLCDGRAGVDLVNPQGTVTGRCLGSGRCVVACQFATPCRCGVAAVTRDGIFCVPCEDAAVCGNGVCEGGETPENCPQDCAQDCTPGQARCASLRVREECNQRGRWEEVSCLPSEVCDSGGGGVCRRSDILVGEDGVVVDEEEPPLPGRVIPDRGAWPGVGRASTGGVISGLERVGSYRVCQSSDNISEGCTWTVRTGTTGDFGNFNDSLLFRPGPGDAFTLLRVTNRVTAGTGGVSPLERSLTRLDDEGLPLEGVDALDLLALDIEGVVHDGEATRDGRWMLLVARNPGLGSVNEPEGPAVVNDVLVRVDLETLAAESSWDSGYRRPGRLAIEDGGETVWTSTRETAWQLVGAGAAQTTRHAPAGPDVLTRVDVAAASASPWAELQGRLEGGGFRFDVDGEGRAVAVTFSGASGGGAGSVHWLELWNLEERERVLTIRGEGRDLEVGQPWFSGQPDRMLLETSPRNGQTSWEMWDLATRQILARYTLDGGWAFSPAGDVIALVRPAGRVVELIAPDTGELLASAPLDVELDGLDTSGSPAVVGAPVFSGDGGRFLIDVRWGNTLSHRAVQVFEVQR